MYNARCASDGRKAGFTLIELLVVMSLIALLGALAVAMVPGLNSHQKVTSGAGQVQGWLLTAKQRALRDQVPRGVRLLASGGVVTDLQYIEQPEDYPPGGLFPSGSPPPVSILAGASQIIGTGGIDFIAGGVQAGDYIQLPIPNGRVYRITGAATTTTTNDTLNVSLPAAVAVPPPGTTSFKVFRQAQASFGEPTLKLPLNIAIDLSLSSIATTSIGGTSYYDILFSPAGEVLGNMGAKSKIILWLRDVTQDAAAGKPGEQTLVSVYTRTGLIAVHPVNISVVTTCPNNVAASTSPVSFTVANASNIALGDNLILDWGSGVQEMQTVTAVAGTTITVGSVSNAHTGPFVVTEYYKFVQDGRSSGL